MTWQDLESRVLDTCVRVFGETVTITPTGEAAQDVRAIFELSRETVEVLGTVVMMGTPMIYLKQDAITGDIQRGDPIVVRGVAYVAAGPVLVDESGELVVWLRRT